MADNKYNQSLLDMGYTQEQIDSMVNAVRSGQNATDVVRGVNSGQPPRAENVNMSTYDGTDGKGNVTTGPWNANLNYNQYGDDSHPNQQSQRGGLNSKYTGEGTSNTYIEYNPNLKTSDLDPNYLYGQAAKDRNRQEAGYIARRNDNIASALYNEGRVSKEDVAAFLSSQNEWMNSTEADRLNTIESVWKRLGQIQPKEEPEEPKEVDTTQIEEDLLKDTSGEIYGKATANEGQPVETLADANSVYAKMNEARVENIKSLLNMSVDDIAVSIYGGTVPYGEQAWRDYQQYYPELAAAVNEKVKKLKAQDTVNAMTTGSDLPTNTSGSSASVNGEITDFANSNATIATSSSEISTNINTMLDSNSTATSAQELMGTLESDMATLKNRLKNLNREANNAFKGDVPQYIVNAYVANRTQEIQDQLSILEDRYNAAYQRYQTEVQQTQWQAEYNLKLEQLQLQKDAAKLDDWATRQGIAIDWYKAMGTGTASGTAKTVGGGTVPTTSLTRKEISASIDELVNACKSGKLGNAQCAAGIQKYYLPTLGIDFGSLSSYEAKKAICTDLAGSYTPQKGDIVVMSSPTKPENGHIGVVIGVDGDTLTYLDWNGSIGSNGSGTEEPAIRTTKLSNSRIYGYYDPTKGQQSQSGGTSGGGYYNEAYADIYSNVLQGKMYTPQRLETAMKTVGASSIDDLRSQAEAWKKAQSSNESAMNMLRAVEYLVSQGANKSQRQIAIDDGKKLWGIGDIIGDIDRFFRGDAADYNSYYKYIKDNMTLDHLVELKNNGATFGALSNQELDAIGNAALALSSSMSDYEFYGQLFTIYNKLRKNVGESEISRTDFNSMISAEDTSGGRDYYLTDFNWGSSSTSTSTPNTNRNGNGGSSSASQKANDTIGG